METNDIKKNVREAYGNVAQAGSSCCGQSSSACCSDPAEVLSKNIGYSSEELKSVPEGSNLGLGCGNPTAIASIKEGETVIDLGSGAGFDSFLAAQKVGNSGKVIGIDMTPPMIDKARANAEKGNHKNVEFRLGEIEHLPAADNTADLIISNCVINLSPEKEKVFKEAWRVLKPGGRMIVSDIVLTEDLPESVINNIYAYVSCIAGAVKRDLYIEHIRNAGFQNVEIIDEISFPLEGFTEDDNTNSFMKSIGLSDEDLEKLAASVKSIRIKAFK
ncbi:arsenite methyltransferase [candidate division KSB1 bacterium]